MDFSTLNWLAVVAAALSTFLLGGLWYSPVLFGKAWQKETGLSDDELKQGNMAKVFGLTFVWSLVMSVNLALFLNAPSTDATWGMTAGFLAGFGWVATGIFVIGLFERRSMRYMLIHGGYMTVALTIMGLIIGAWR